MSTPHIESRPGAFAPTVLLPGDPLRAEHIATRLLEGAERVNAVRNMFGFTGRWRGHPVSVMGTGMGIPSCSIYATELVRHFGVRRLIRLGTCGAVHSDLDLGDVVVALGASTDSGVNRTRFAGMDLAATASWSLLHPVATVLMRSGTPIHVGNVFSADLFYDPRPNLLEHLASMNILAVEMEAAGLYGLAAEHRVEALAVLVVSDHLRRNERMSSEERQRGSDTLAASILDALFDQARRAR